MELQIQTTCQNCSRPIEENYCPNCGIPTMLERIDKKYALKEFVNLFGFEKGFLFTIREVLLRPGQTTHDYLTKNRHKYTKPLTFLLATSALYTLLVHYLHADSILQQSMAKANPQSHGQSGLQWMQDNYGYANILSGIFTVYFLKKFFKKYTYNFYEISVHLFFVIGEGMVILLLMPINTKYLNSVWIESLLSIFVYLYIAWALGQFFEKKFSSYVKAFIAYMLGILVFGILLAVVGAVYELISERI
jgi:Protein of unknown function (DUF3667)